MTDLPRNGLAACGLGALLCGIHLGANEYVSVQFVAFAATAVMIWPWYLRELGRISAMAAVLLVPVIVSYFAARHDPVTLLKGIRSVLVLVVLCAWQSRLQQGTPAAAETARRALVIACIASLTLAFLQFADAMLLDSGLFNMPASLYAIDYGTLAADRREAGLFSRPSAFFSEPSSLAALGVLAVAVSFIARSVALRVLGFAIVIISQSLAGLVLATGISLLSLRWGQGRALVAVLVVGMAAVAFLLIGSAGERIVLVFTATDLSARIRLFEPLLVLRDMFAAGQYFGATPEFLMSLAAPEVFTIFDNWFSNQLLLYGVPGVLWILVAFVCVRPSLWPLLAAYMVTNGDALYYDRYFLLLVAMAAVSDLGARRHDDLDRHRGIQ